MYLCFIFNRIHFINLVTVSYRYILQPQLPIFFFLLFSWCLHQPGSAIALPPGCPLTVCCIGSIGLHPCHSYPSQCLPCSAFHSRTCLTLQPLSEMDERRKHILLLWATHTQWGATKCPLTASLKRGQKGL